MTSRTATTAHYKKDLMTDLHAPRHRRHRGGFTLVELLVVVGIIALLVGILLPALSRAREAARGVTCLSQTRSIGQGLVLYGNANRLKIPPGQGFEDSDGEYLDALSAGYVYKPDRQVHWSDYPFIGNYLPNPIKVGKINQRAGRSGYTHEDRDTAFTCPSDDSPGHNDGNGRFLSYGVINNVWPQRNKFQSPAQAQKQYTDRLFRLSAVVSPSSTLFVLDGFASTYKHTAGTGWQTAPSMLVGIDRSVNASNRHAGRTNVAWFDGSARAMPNSEETRTLRQAHAAREFKVSPTKHDDF